MMGDFVSLVRGIVGATVIVLAEKLTDLGERIIGMHDPEPRMPEHGDGADAAMPVQDPITPEAAAMLEPRPRPTPPAPTRQPLAGSVESRMMKARAF